MCSHLYVRCVCVCVFFVCLIVCLLLCGLRSVDIRRFRFSGILAFSSSRVGSSCRMLRNVWMLNCPLHSATSQMTSILERYVYFVHVFRVHYIFSCNDTYPCIEGNCVPSHMALRLRLNNGKCLSYRFLYSAVVKHGSTSAA